MLLKKILDRFDAKWRSTQHGRFEIHLNKAGKKPIIAKITVRCPRFQVVELSAKRSRLRLVISSSQYSIKTRFEGRSRLPAVVDGTNEAIAAFIEAV